MKNILFVNACTRPCSRTYDLAKFVLDKLSKANQQIEQMNLYEEELHPLDWAALQERSVCTTVGDFSGPAFRYARQFASADQIVIAAPYWDLLFPAILRTYLEAVTAVGVTFRYTSDGIPVGMCQAKQMIYVTTAGGFIGDRNYGFDYIRSLAQNFYGIQEVGCVTAEGLDIFGADPAAIMEHAKQNVPEF